MDLQNYRQQISQKLKSLRKQHNLTQVEFCSTLDISQSRLSEIERGNGSLSAEQFLLLLKKFNVAIEYFIREKKPIDQTLQNTLARLGGSNLKTTEQLPSEKIKTVNEAIVETLCDASSSRLIVNLIPVIIKNAAQIDKYKLEEKLENLGYAGRLYWIIDGSLNAVKSRLENYVPRNIQKIYRQAEIQLKKRKQTTSLLFENDYYEDSPDDILDADITSQKTLDSIKETRDELAKKWKIVTRITQEDMLSALIASEKNAG